MASFTRGYGTGRRALERSRRASGRRRRRRGWWRRSVRRRWRRRLRGAAGAASAAGLWGGRWWRRRRGRVNRRSRLGCASRTMAAFGTALQAGVRSRRRFGSSGRRWGRSRLRRSVRRRRGL
jgi:hypothetical protein